ncbi:hypothetical protein B0H11DRAFT_1909455 [Mycena galericulata]|nr:hypothetical protein B0H11DRAFT_1909455 [Mycena galericulata]
MRIGQGMSMIPEICGSLHCPSAPIALLLGTTSRSSEAAGTWRLHGLSPVARLDAADHKFTLHIMQPRTVETARGDGATTRDQELERAANPCQDEGPLTKRRRLLRTQDSMKQREMRRKRMGGEGSEADISE